MSRPKVSVALSATPLCKAFLRAAEADGAIELDLREVKPIHRAFRPMVMDAAFDLSELAIVTALQAVDHGKPIVPLPVTVAARFQHRCIVQNAKRTNLRPKDLPGRRVAVRAYSQTTGFWVRNILELEHGVTSDSITWVTQEAPHVAEAAEPSNVVRDPNGAGPGELLERGDVAAAIFGNDLPTDAWIEPVIDNPDEQARASFARSGVVPINHVVAVSRDFAARHPDIVKYVYDTFAASRPHAFDGEKLELHPCGFDAMRHSVDVLLRLAAAQKLTTKHLSFDDFFGEAARLIGAG
jgi:4,5-dihydroxyphthalate decarboxylase